MGKKRKLIDVCGHHRCFTCITQNENCRVCSLHDPVAPAKKSLPFRQKFSPVPIQRSLFKGKSGTPTVVSSAYGTPRLGRGSPAKQQDFDFSVQRTPKSSLGRRSVWSAFSRIQENEIYNAQFSENDEGFEDIRKFKSSNAYNGLERYLNKGVPPQSARSVSRMGRMSSQLQTSCSSLASSTGSVTPSDLTNTLLSTSRTSYDTSSLSQHRMSGALINESRQMVYTPRSRSRFPSCIRHEQLPLRPLFFEVPTQEEEPVFIGRQWLFREMEMTFASDISSNRGIIISGKSGSGKTSILLQLVEHSCFGRRSHDLDVRYVPGGRGTLGDASYAFPEALRNLASRVVAYQFCQVENNISCLVPEFLHSVAAQLCQAPQLAAYRDYLFEMPSCQKYLSKTECIRNPTESLMKGILDPLNYLYKLNKISNEYYIIIIDAVCEAEYHRSDAGDTIGSFLSKNILKFPCWLKVVITIRSQHQSIVTLIPFYRIKLEENDEAVTQDLFDYVTYRLKKDGIRKNILASGVKNDANHFAFVKRLIKLSIGNFLYTRLALDLIEENRLQIKSPEFKELPKYISDVFLKLCSVLYPTNEAFAKVMPILSVCLAALNPLTLLEIYHSINCLNATERLTWENFTSIFQECAPILPKRSDGTYMLFHHSFRDWLLQREESENKKFFCDLRIGHAAIAFRLSRVEAPLSETKVLELGHHILKAHIYKNMPASKMSVPPRDLQALWLANVSQDLSQSLACPANIYYPNVKVSRLLLLAGANPNERTQWRNAPLLSVCAGEGLCEMVSLLIEFGVDINAADEDGNTALHTAAEHDQLDVVRLLIQQGALISQVNHDEECALVKAAVSNRLNVLAFLLQRQNWDVAQTSTTSSPASSTATSGSRGISLAEAAQHALVAASAYGHIAIIEHILQEIQPAVNQPDTLYGENPLTVACANGLDHVVQFLLSQDASVNAVNMRDCPPLLCAAKGGHASIMRRLLDEGAGVNRTDANKRTALILAAKEGHGDAVHVLLNRGGIDLNAVDKDGLSALSWAALRGHTNVVQFLLETESVDVNQADVSGRTPLDLASYCGNGEIAQMLLDSGAVLEHVDLQGARPLDRAVGCGHQHVVQLFLRRGAKLGPATWTMATGKPSLIMVLLNKLLEDGNVLLRKGQLKDAVYRYQYALRKIPVNEYDEGMQAAFDEMKMTFMLQLSRCKQKMNEEEEAIQLASEVIKMQPTSAKAYHIRARAYQTIKEITEALNDVNRAIELVGQNTELRRQLFRLKDELSRESRAETWNMSPRLANPSLSSNFKRSSPTASTATTAPAATPNGTESVSPK